MKILLVFSFLICFSNSAVFAQWLNQVRQNYHIQQHKKKKEKSKKQAEEERKKRLNKINEQLNFDAEKEFLANQTEAILRTDNNNSSTFNNSTLPIVKIAPSALSEYKKLLELVNEIRKKGCECGGKKMKPVAPLVLDTMLIRVAELHSTDMATNKYFDHRGKDGSSPYVRYNRFTKQQKYYIGENIYVGSTTPESAFSSWLGSTGHCENMMNANYKKMGAGKAGIYWTQMFMD